jgi:hypothetical protein
MNDAHPVPYERSRRSLVGLHRQTRPGDSLGRHAPIQLAAIPGIADRPAVAIRFVLPDGRVVIAETSLALLATAVDTFLVRYE